MSSSSSKYITSAYSAGVYINVYSWFQPTVLVCKSMGIDGFSLQRWYIHQGVLIAPAYSAVVHTNACEWLQLTVLLCINGCEWFQPTVLLLSTAQVLWCT